MWESIKLHLEAACSGLLQLGGQVVDWLARLTIFEQLTLGISVLALVATLVFYVFPRKQDLSAAQIEQISNTVADNIRKTLGNDFSNNIATQIQELARSAVRSVHESGPEGAKALQQLKDSGDASAAVALLRKLAAEEVLRGAEARARAAAHYREIGALVFAADTNEAIDAYKTSLELEPENVFALTDLAILYSRIGRKGDALQLFDKGLDNANSAQTRAMFLHNRGVVQETLGELAAAEASYNAALDALGNDVGDNAITESIYTSLGTLLIVKGEFQKARVFFEALLSNKDPFRPQSQGLWLKSAGIACLSTKDYDKAQDYLEQASALAADDMLEKASAFANLALLHEAKEEYDKAEQLILQSLEIHESLQDASGTAIALNNLGSLYIKTGRLSEAEPRLLDAIATASRAGLREPLATTLANQGTLALNRGDVRSACQKWSEARVIFEEIGSRHNIKRIDSLKRRHCAQ